jgi:excisionase family DNA binding protein
MVEPKIDEIMTMEELSSYLKISRYTLYKLVQEGKLPGQKIDKQWRFGKKSIDPWMNDGSGRLSGDDK